MIITYTFIMARWKIFVKKSEATKQNKDQNSNRNKQTENNKNNQKLFLKKDGGGVKKANN